MKESKVYQTQNFLGGYINYSSLAIDTFNPRYINDFVIPEVDSMNNKNSLNDIKIKMRKKRLKNRSRKELVSEIQKLAKININYLNYSYLRKIKRNDLLLDAVKHFGGWRKAVISAGFRPIQKGWTKKEIIDELLSINDELGHTPTRDELRELGRNDLERAATRHFGSWNKALIAANLKPNKITNWTKDRAISKLKKIAEELGHSPSMRELKKRNDYNLLNMGIKFFGTYNNFLKTANLKIVLEMNKWPKIKIIQELQNLHSEMGRTPRRNELAAIKRYDLINAAETYFPSWSEALIAAGLVPNSDVLTDDTTWREWESLIFNYLESRKIDYKKKRYIKKIGYPDIYIPSQNKIIEIKINCSDNSVKKDIQKYLPHCKTLEIWYLYGKPFGILSNKVRFVGSNEIKEKLSGIPDLLIKFNEIKKKTKENRLEAKDKKSSRAWQWCKLD